MPSEDLSVACGGGSRRLWLRVSTVGHLVIDAEGGRGYALAHCQILRRSSCRIPRLLHLEMCDGVLASSPRHRCLSNIREHQREVKNQKYNSPTSNCVEEKSTACYTHSEYEVEDGGEVNSKGGWAAKRPLFGPSQKPMLRAMSVSESAKTIHCNYSGTVASVPRNARSKRELQARAPRK